MKNLPKRYDYASFTVSNGQSDYDVNSNEADVFSNIKQATRVIIKTDKNITVKFNSTLLPAFPINIGDSPFQLPPDYMEISNIFISNSSGDTATIKVWLF